MKAVQILLTLFSLVAVSLMTCNETVVGQSYSFSAEEAEIFMLPEMGAIILSGDEGLKVEMVMPSEQRDENYKDVDLEKGDIIKMMNGKKMESIEIMQAIYDSLELEDEIKIAIMRGKKIHIVSFPKGEAGENMVMQTMTITTDTKGEGGLQVKDGKKTMSFDGEVTLIHEIGLIISEEDGKLIVAGTMPMGVDIRKLAGLEEGDKITAVQGKKTVSVVSFNEIYDNLKAGQEVNLEFAHKGTVKMISFKKADGTKKVIMKSK